MSSLDGGKCDTGPAASILGKWGKLGMGGSGLGMGDTWSVTASPADLQPVLRSVAYCLHVC